MVPNDSHSWIGLSDEAVKGTYESITGETFSYTNWNAGEPSSDTNLDYVEFLGSNAKWNELTNEHESITDYIIENVPTPIPNP